MKLINSNNNKRNPNKESNWIAVNQLRVLKARKLMIKRQFKTPLQCSNNKIKQWHLSMCVRGVLMKCCRHSMRKSKLKIKDNLSNRELLNCKKKKKRPTKGSGTCRDSRSLSLACSRKRKWSKILNITFRIAWSNKRSKRDKCFRNVVKIPRSKSRDTKN